MPIPPFQPPLEDEFGEPRACARCGRIFERPVTAELDGVRIRLIGHAPGDSVCRTATPLGKSGVILDARMRRAARASL